MKSEKNLGEVVGVKGGIKIKKPNEYVPLLLMKDGKEIGRLEFEGDVVVFKGKADEAARIFFEISKGFIDRYIEEKLRGDE